MATPLNTDDSALRLEYPWLGTVDVPMMIRARMLTWVRLLMLTMASWVGLWVLLPATLFIPASVHEDLAKTFTVGVVGVAVGALVTWRTARHITPVSPVTYFIQLFRDELNAPEATSPTSVHRLALDKELWVEDDPSLADMHKIVPDFLTKDQR